MEETRMKVEQRRITAEQKRTLQRYMNENPELKHGQFTADFTPYSAQMLWNKIVTTLNKLPGARKSCSHWKRTWQDIKRNSKKSEIEVVLTNDEAGFQHIDAEKLQERVYAGDELKKLEVEMYVTDEASYEDSGHHDSSNVLSYSDNFKEETQNDASATKHRRIRLSSEQKTVLNRFMKQYPHLREGTFSTDFTYQKAQKLWIKIATKLNNIQGARKTWRVWRKTWKDMKKNSKKAGEELYVTAEICLQNTYTEKLDIEECENDEDDDKGDYNEVLSEGDNSKTWQDIKRNSKKSEIEMVLTNDEAGFQHIDAEKLQEKVYAGDELKKLEVEMYVTDEASYEDSGHHDSSNVLSYSDNFKEETQNDASATKHRRIRLSSEQKTVLNRFMKQYPHLREGTFSTDFTYQKAQKLWMKIATKLNNIQGARKTWRVWRKTWQDMKKNSKKAGEELYVTAETCLQNNYTEKLDIEECENDEDDDKGDYNEVLSEGDNSKDECGASTDLVKIRYRAKNMSKIQKQLLYNLVKLNDKLNDGKDGYVNVGTKRKEWKRIAAKLNSHEGPEKSWLQWKKCWSDIRKYYARDEDIKKVCNVEENTFATAKENDDEMSNRVSASQLNCIFTSVVQRSKRSIETDIWTSMCKKLNDIGPHSKTPLGWERVWTDYKLKVKQLVDNNGLEKCNHLQRLTYEYIQRENEKGMPKESIDNRLEHHQLAHQECNIFGSLVAAKLQSMRREQKLIAEKLISDILFQGQMEMFQYSEKAVSIPGYT